MTKHTVNGQGVSALKRLYALESKRANITSEITLEVLRARKGGASWAMIASSLGVTAQAAWDRYTDRATTGGMADLVPLPGMELGIEEALPERRQGDAKERQTVCFMCGEQWCDCVDTERESPS